MSVRSLSALLASLMLTASAWSAAPALAQDDMDLDSLMSEDPERAAPAEDEADSEEADESEGGGDDEVAIDNSMVDEERPPVDEDAFVKPEEEVGPAQEGDLDDGENRPISAALLLGYGFNFDGPANAWGFGFGARGGYDLGLFSLGLRFAYFLGESKQQLTVDRLGLSVPEDISRSFWELSLDAGLDLDVGKSLTIRPGIGLGLAVLTSGDSSDVAPTFAPGLTINYNATDSFFVGLETRYQLITAQPSTSGLALLLGFGLRF